MVDSPRPARPLPRGAFLAAAACLLSFAFLIGGLLCVKSARILELEPYLEGLTRRDQEGRDRLLEVISTLEAGRDPVMNSVTDEELAAGLLAPAPKGKKKTAAGLAALGNELKLRLLKKQLEKPSELSDQIDALMPNLESFRRSVRSWTGHMCLALGLAAAALFVVFAARGPGRRPSPLAVLRAAAWSLPALLPALVGWALFAHPGRGGPLTPEARAAALYDLSKYLQISGGLGILLALFIPGRAEKAFAEAGPEAGASPSPGASPSAPPASGPSPSDADNR